MGKPLKRHTALIPLSQDHHFGLLLVWKIRKGIKEQVEKERIIQYLNYYMKEHLEPHFQTEEKAVFSFLPKNDPLRIQAERQHQELRNHQAEIAKPTTISYDQLAAFADRLEAHIRFEERELFQYMQKTLMEEDLETMEKTIQEIHDREGENWEDCFWGR